MEPRIQYVKTVDGVNIAYSSFGAGPALVCSPDPVWGTNLSAWRVPEARACYERMARGRMLVGYDSRGTGESDRSAKDYSLEGLLRDLDAVVDATGFESFALLGEYFAGPVAIAYAARYPERVSHLILRCALAATSTYSESPYSQAFSSLRSMAGQEWELYVKTMVYTSIAVPEVISCSAWPSFGAVASRRANCRQSSLGLGRMTPAHFSVRCERRLW